MGIKKKENYGILFHHFHANNKFYFSPGSLTKKKFNDFILKYKNQILNPNDFFLKLKKKKVCLTFDDGLKCQKDIVLPILKKYNIKACFFVPTSNFTKNFLSVEIIRYLKYKKFKSSNTFYKSFFDLFKKTKYLSKLNKINFSKHEKNIKKHSPYYSKLDIQHKILRDFVVSEESYKRIMLKILKQKNCNLEKLNKKLLMSKKDVIELVREGHEVGLHSHSHSFKFYKLSYKNEFNEFKKNKLILENLVKKKITTASFPFGYKTKNSYKILKKLKIVYAFNKNFYKNKNDLKYQRFNISRENISNLI